MRYAPSLAALVALSALLAGCPREPDDTGDTGDTDTGDTDTGDTDSGDTDTDSGDTDTDSGDTDSGDTSDTSDTGTGPTDRLLMFTEVVSADMHAPDTASSDRVPKFVEITNVGTTAEDLSEYTLALWPVTNQGAISPTLRVLGEMTGSLAPGESYVVEFETDDVTAATSGFFATYGFEPDLLVDDTAGNGDDTFALYFGAATGDGSNATLIDIYGQIGVDGTGSAWEYDDTYGCRLYNGTVVPNATWTAGEWNVGALKLLAVSSNASDNPKELPLVLAYTTPGEWDADSCPPAGPECTEATDCPMPDSPCMEAVCNPDLTCGEQPIGEGPLPDTTPGDCKTPACDASGNETVANADDPLADTFCVDNTCVDGTPTPVPQNEDAPLPSEDQTAGDCERLVCDNGTPTPENFDDPPANTQCTTYVCTDGDPVPTQTPAGTALPEGEQTPEDCRELYCDENGDTQTRFIEDAPADLDCETYSCDLTDGDLITSWPGNAKVLTDTEPGDCHDLVCKEGENATEELVNDEDLPADTECSLGDCADGVPTPLYSDEGDACLNDPGVCSADHECVECISDAQCGGGTCDLDLNECLPGVVDTTPAPDATDVAVDTDVVITFSRGMDPASLTFQSGPGPCSGTVQLSFDEFETCVGFASATWSEGDTVATLVPSADLVYDQFYELLVTTGVESAGGAPLAEDYTGLVFITESFAGTCAEGVVISQVYPGGGNSGATWKQDFVELYNRGSTPVDITGWSLQYTNATGSNWITSGAITELNGTIQPHSYFLVQQAAGTGGTTDLPTPDDTGVIGLGASAGKVALVNNTTVLTVSCPTGGNIVDFVGYGTTANCFEGAGRAPAPSATNADIRRSSGCFDAGDNSADYLAAPASPRNSSSPKSYCSCEGDTLANGLGSASIEADYCKMLAPSTLTATRNTASPAVTSEIFEDPYTGQTTGALYKAQVGYGPLGSDPRAQVSWVFFDAPFTADAGNNDEHSGSIVAPVVTASTQFAYVYRFEIAGGWTYCDLGGSGSNTSPANLDFNPADLGTLTVNP